MKAWIWIIMSIIMGLIGVSLGAGKIEKPKTIKRKQVLVDSIRIDSVNVKIYMSYGKED